MKSKASAWEEWIDKAEDDELSIPACFLSQQMAEKCLKALLVCRNIPFPKVHDLLVLETLLIDVDPGIHQIHDQLQLLNGYYIETRYPSDYPEFTLNEAKEAFGAAEMVKEIVLRTIHKL